MTMNKLFSILICMMFGQLCAQNEQIEAVQEKVDAIRENRQELLRLKRVETVSAYYYIYYEAKAVKLIESMQLDEGLEKKVDWFFDNGQLLYTETRWEKPETGVLVHSEKTYHVDGKLIFWEKEGESLDSSHEEYLDTEKNLKNYSERVLREAETLRPE